MNYFTFIFAILIGAACFWMSFKMIKLYLKVKNWDRVPANVISKEIVIHPKYSTTRTPYGLKAEYTYHIKNVAYTGHMIYLVELVAGQANHIKSDAENRLHKIEKTIQIFVNPNDPKQSVMYCEGISLYVFIFCMGVLSFLIALASLL